MSFWSRHKEREGFEPSVLYGHNGFQDRHLKPLGHLSVTTKLHHDGGRLPVYLRRKLLTADRSLSSSLAETAMFFCA